MTRLRQHLLSGIAGQLGRPHGLLAPLVARALNRGNARAIAAAVDAADVPAGGVAADIGFGGGLGLRLLLDRVGNDGTVHGIEIADDMLRRARSSFTGEIESGRLRLAKGSLTELPLDDGSVDALITLNTLYFVADLGAASAELARAVRAGGRAIIGIGDPEVMGRSPVTDHGFTLRPVTEIAAALTNSGFQVDQQRMDDTPMPRYTIVGLRG
jgi:arsenite methyltransferase